MTESQKRTYRTMALTFLGIALAFGIVALAELVFTFEFFSGNVLPMASFLAVIGALLLQTVRQSETREIDIREPYDEADYDPVELDADFESEPESDLEPKA